MTREEAITNELRYQRDQANERCLIYAAELAKVIDEKEELKAKLDLARQVIEKAAKAEEDAQWAAAKADEEAQAVVECSNPPDISV